MKAVRLASGEVSLLRRVLAKVHDGLPHPELLLWTRQDVKARDRILEKLSKAEQPSDPGVNAPALEATLLAYGAGKVAELALPNWQRYSRQAAQVGATVADAQTIGRWMSMQGWLRPGSQT